MPQPGHWIELPEGCRTFLPDPLPPSIEWTSRLINALSDADRNRGTHTESGDTYSKSEKLTTPST